MARRIVISGWLGSENLGDELILASLAQALKACGAEPVAISIDPTHTSCDRDIAIIIHHHLGQSMALRRVLLHPVPSRGVMSAGQVDEPPGARTRRLEIKSLLLSSMS